MSKKSIVMRLAEVSRRALARRDLVNVVLPVASATTTRSSSTASSSSSVFSLSGRRRQPFGSEGASSSHDDFAAKSHVDATNVHDEIAADVKKETVVIYMKGSPNAPQCGFSNVACRILDHYGIPYASRNVLASDALRNGIKSFSNWPTIPQVFIGGEFLGGSDILMTMHQDGSLKKEFEKVGLTVKTGGSD